jgi:large subunit ribosomal protein L29
VVKATKYREKTVDELRNDEKELRDQLLRLRFQSAAGNVENPLKARAVRKDLARLLTVLREKQEKGGPTA